MKFNQWLCGMFKGHSYNTEFCVCEKCGLFLKKKWSLYHGDAISEDNIKKRCGEALNRINSGEYDTEEEFFAKSESSEVKE